MKWLKEYWIYVVSYLAVGGIAYFVGYLIYKRIHTMNATEWVPDLHDAIEQWEGREHTAYYDLEAPNSPYRYHGGKGKLTIGVGHTGPVNGEAIYEGLQIDDATIDKLLQIDTGPTVSWIKSNVTGEHTNGQFNAALSFLFNTGKRDSDLWKLINSGKPKDVADWLDPDKGNHYTTSEGVRLPGLISRRRWESSQFA